MRHTVEEIRLKNGASGLIIHVPGASVMNTKVQFRAGMRYAKKRELAEIAHIVEHLSFGANSAYHDEQAYEAEFTKNGAYHNAWTSDFSVCYEAECADFEWSRILDLKRIAITSPRFNEAELTSEKGNVRSELTGYMNDYSRLLWPRLQVAIGESVPSLRERLSTVNNITLKDIREHYKRTHTAKNMRFIIAGKIGRFRRRQVIKMLESWDLKPGKLYDTPKDDLYTSGPVLIRRKDANNLTFGLSFVVPHRISEKEVRAMDCLNHILTGTMNSRIFGQARKRGLVYSIGTYLSNSVNNASWDFDGEVNLESAEELFDLINKELKLIENGDIKDKDIAAAKTYALGRYQVGAQTVGQISDFYADTYFMSGEVTDYDRTPSVIRSIEKADIVKIAKEFLDSGIKGFVTVGSCEKAFVVNLSEKITLGQTQPESHN